MDVKVPDIGDFKDVPVITVLVKVGDTVAAEDPLIELESDKATMEVEAIDEGVLAKILVPEGTADECAEKLSPYCRNLLITGGHGDEAERDRRLRRERGDQRVRAQAMLQPRHRRAGEAEDGHPQQH